MLLCPFVQTCSCARTRAFSLIHADLVNSDVKTALGQNLILLFLVQRKCVFLWRCLEADGNVGDRFNLTKAHALIGTQIRIAA